MKYNVTVIDPPRPEVPFLAFEIEVEDHAAAVFITIAVLDRVRKVVTRRGDESDGRAILRRESDGEVFEIKRRDHEAEGDA